MNKILIEVLEMDQYDFFKRIANGFSKLGYECHYVTNNILVYLKAKQEKQEIYLLRKNYKQNQKIYSDLNKSMSILLNRLSRKEAKITYSSEYNMIEKLHKKNSYEYAFMTNGGWTTNIALRDYAVNNEIKVLFFELGNIPNKIFVDTKGINAQSNLYENISILDNFEVSEKEYTSWRDKYIEKKLQSHFVPQSSGINKTDLPHIRIFRILLCLISLIIQVPLNSKSDFNFYKLCNLFNRRINFKYDSIDIEKTKYLFFPLQVSSDTQVMLNSDITLIEAIEKVRKIAQKKDFKLIIKPHPAESDKNCIKKIYDLKNKYGFFFVNENTFKLIKHAEEVVTINSTVGLEAMIMEKPVTFLGRSFFAKFDKRYLRNYIISYLINADYFNNETISEDIVKEIINRYKQEYKTVPY